MTEELPDIPREVLHRAVQEWIWAEGREFGKSSWCGVAGPHRDRIRRVLREVETAIVGASADVRRQAFRAAFEDRLTGLQRELLARMVEEHADQFDDPWLQLGRAANILAEHSRKPPGARRQSKDRAGVSMTGLRAFARVIEEWWRSQGHGWTYGDAGNEPKLAERLLLKAARTTEPEVTRTHVRSVMKNPG